MGVLMEVFLKFLTSEPEQRKSVFLKFLTASTLPNGAQGPHSPLDPTGAGWDGDCDRYPKGYGDGLGNERA